MPVLSRLVKFSVHHPWAVITAALLVTIALALPMRNLKIQPDVESLLPENMEGPGENLAAETQSFDKLLVMVKGDSLYTVENLQLFEKTFEELSAKLPVVESVSPFSSITLEKTGNRLTPVTLSPGGKAPATEEDLAVFRSRLAASKFAPGFVSSKDGDALAFYLLVGKTDKYLAEMDQVNLILQPLREHLEVAVTGTSPFSAETERFLTQGFSKLLVLVVITILISYYLGFRSKRAVFLPITLVLSGTIFAVGIMSLAGFELTMVSIISPPLILTLGSSYSIHVMNAYYSAVASASGKDKKELIVDSVSDVSGTILLASVTTLIGLMSLLFATISQTREFAVSTALGVFFSAVLSVTLLPAFLSLQSVPKERRLKSLEKDPLSRFLLRFGPALVNSRKQTIVVLAVIAAAFVFCAPRVEFNTSPSKYFPSTSQVIKNHNAFLGEIGGYDELTVKLTGPEKDYFLKPEVLDEIWKIENELASNPDISYIFSFPQYLDFASYIMSGKNGDFSSKGLNRYVARLFSAANGDGSYASEDFSEISILLRVYNSRETMPIDEKDTKNLVAGISSVMENSLPDDIQWELSGISLGFLKLSGQMRRDFLVSTIAALIMIGIVTSIVFKSAVKGILSITPMLTGIFSSLILMFLFKIPLDMTTIMVSCITIGVGVDDSIHFLLQYRKMNRLYPASRDKAVYETIIHTGRPIVITTLSIVAGLLFLSFAQFQPIRYFGLLIVFTLLTTCFSTVILLPSLTGLKRGKN